MNRFQFVADHSDTFEVKRLCELVEVERSSFYAWKAAAPTRAAGDAQLAERIRIRVVHDDDKHLWCTTDHRGAQRRREPWPAGQPQAGRAGDA